MTRRWPPRLIVAGLLAALAFAGLVALGTWQVHRLAWKRALIAQVDARVHAAPVAVPGPADWAGISLDHDAYRRVTVAGTYLPGRDTLVQAVTDYGSGNWVMTPLVTARGFTVLVNRGFVAAGARVPAASVTPVRVTGLLRISEPRGGFLRTNDPVADRWYSRDVTAIAAARRLTAAAPYFVDADAASAAHGGPIGGLTVIAFANNHLVYAITWYTLALMVVGGFIILVRTTWRASARVARQDR